MNTAPATPSGAATSVAMIVVRNVPHIIGTSEKTSELGDQNGSDLVNSPSPISRTTGTAFTTRYAVMNARITTVEVVVTNRTNPAVRSSSTTALTTTNPAKASAR